MQVIEKPTVLEALRSDGSPEMNRAIVELGRSKPTERGLIYMDIKPDNTKCLTGTFDRLSRWINVGDWVVKYPDGKLKHLTNAAFSEAYLEIEVDAPAN